FRIYQQQATAKTTLPVPTGASTLRRAVEAQEHAQSPVVHGRRFKQETQTAFPTEPSPAANRESLAEFHFQFLERLAAPSVIIHRDYDIVHLSERAGRFLSFSGGEPSNNLLRVVHPMLRTELRA